jgi:hypothetical protein
MWMGIIAYVAVGIVLVALNLITMVRSAGHR